MLYIIAFLLLLLVLASPSARLLLGGTLMLIGYLLVWALAIGVVLLVFGVILAAILA